MLTEYKSEEKINLELKWKWSENRIKKLWVKVKCKIILGESEVEKFFEENWKWSENWEKIN